MNTTSTTPVLPTPIERPEKAVRERPASMLETSAAIRRALVSEHYTGQRSPEAARSWLRRLVKENSDPALVARGERGRLWVHPRLHPALSEPPATERPASGLKDLPAARRNLALLKAQVIRDLADYGRAHRLGRTLARRRFAQERAGHYGYSDGQARRVLKFTAGSLARWQAIYERGGADALADSRGRWERSQPDAQAAELYWRLRNDSHRFGISYCHRVVSAKADELGWRWFSTEAACRKWDRRNRDDRALTLNQGGEQEYTRHCGPYLEMDPESFAPGQCLVSDDCTVNVWVIPPDGGAPIRPVLSACLDWRSRVITGWRVIREGNEHAALLAFRQAAERFGLPEVAIVDNGKNFVSWQWRGGRPLRRVRQSDSALTQQLQGIFELCGIRLSPALPYNPNAKARLERWFRTLDDQLFRAFPSYCGNSSNHRPEDHRDLVAKAVAWEQFVAKLAEYIEAYNQRPHGAEDMEGRSPLQVMQLATRRRSLPDHVRPFLLAAWHRPVAIGRNGVSIKVCGHTLRYGAFDPAIQALPIGTQVRVGYDPEDVSKIQVWTMEYRHVCEAAINQRMNRSINTEGLREAVREKKRLIRARRRATQVGTDYLRDPVDMAVAALCRDSDKRRLPDPPGPEGGPLLVPVLTPVEVPANQGLRKAAGAEGMDARQRLEAFVRQPAPASRPVSVAGLLRDFAHREGQS